MTIKYNRSRAKYNSKHIWSIDADPSKTAFTADDARERFGDARIHFDSIREYERWKDLKLYEVAGLIKQLETHKVFILRDTFTARLKKVRSYQPRVTRKFKAWRYEIDFWYYDCEAEQWVGEDVKGVQTREFKEKWAQLHLMKLDDLEAGRLRLELIK